MINRWEQSEEINSWCDCRLQTSAWIDCSSSATSPLTCRYKSLSEQAVGSRQVSREAWDQQTRKAQASLQEGDHKLNQLRFTLQKFMIGHNKFGLQFDPATNASMQAVLLRYLIVNYFSPGKFSGVASCLGN